MSYQKPGAIERKMVTKRTLKHVEKDIEMVKRVIELQKQYLKTLEEELVQFKSRQLFKLPNGEKVPLNKITLVTTNHTVKGLGWDEDRDYFSEYVLIIPGYKQYFRLLSTDVQQRLGVPTTQVKSFGSYYIKQKVVGYNDPFAQKFKEMIDIPAGKKIVVDGVEYTQFYNL